MTNTLLRIAGVLIFCLVFYALANAFTPRDDTDGEKRSRMGLYTDHGTGCQYLATANIWGAASITPRLDAEGRHMCKGEK